MIQVTTRRAGPICLAATVDDNRHPTMTWGFTREGAARRLIRREGRRFR